MTLPQVHHSYFSEILAGAAEALYAHDMRTVICPTEHQHDREVSLLERLMQGTTDGAVLILPEESSDELAALHDHGYRFVIVDPLTHLDERVPTVSAAHSSGASEAVDHLLGARSPADRRDHRSEGLGRDRGAAARLPRVARRGRSDARPRARAAVGLPHRGRASARRCRCSICREPPTAIFAFNDPLAIGAMRAARMRGIRVPEQLSIVGFDDTFEASIVTPALTTVRQPLAEMGRMAVNLLIRLLQNERIEALHVELATKLTVRESTAPRAR